MIKYILIFVLFSSFAYASGVSITLKKMDGTYTKITVQDLEKIVPHSITTKTNFTGKSDFLGVTFRDFIDTYKIKSNRLRIFALDDYSFTLNTSELFKYDVILAYKKNGGYMPISELGPFAVIYPKDQYPELDNLSVNAKTVWQIYSIEELPNE